MPPWEVNKASGVGSYALNAPFGMDGFTFELNIICSNGIMT
jgi:hypothetical protein